MKELTLTTENFEDLIKECGLNLIGTTMCSQIFLVALPDTTPMQCRWLSFSHIEMMMLTPEIAMSRLNRCKKDMAHAAT